MTTDRDFPADDAERAWLAALPRTSPLDPAAENRLVDRLRQEGRFRRRRPVVAIAWRLAAAAALFASGALVGANVATRNTLEAMLARQGLPVSERILLVQRAGSAYVEAAERLAGAAPADARASEVASQTLIGAAEAAARATVDAGLAPRLASLLDEPRPDRGATPSSTTTTIIWY